MLFFANEKWGFAASLSLVDWLCSKDYKRKVCNVSSLTKRLSCTFAKLYVGTCFVHFVSHGQWQRNQKQKCDSNKTTYSWVQKTSCFCQLLTRVIILCLLLNRESCESELKLILFLWFQSLIIYRSTSCIFNDKTYKEAKSLERDLI